MCVRYDAALTFDDAAEALDWLCRALTVPHALRAAERGAVAAAARLAGRLAVGSACKLKSSIDPRLERRLVSNSLNVLN